MTDETPATTDEPDEETSPAITDGAEHDAGTADEPEPTPHERQIFEAREVAGHLLAVATAGGKLDRDQLRSFCYEMAARADEWDKAAADLEAVGPAGIIVPIGSCVPGMHVPSWSEDDSTWVAIRRITRNEQIGVLVPVLERGYSKDQWRNLMSPTSPVVVRR